MKINFDNPAPRPTNMEEAQAIIDALWPLGKEDIFSHKVSAGTLGSVDNLLG